VKKIINNYTKSIKIDLVSSRGSSGSSKKSTCWCLHSYFYLGRDKASKFKVNVLSERQKRKSISTSYQKFQQKPNNKIKGKLFLHEFFKIFNSN